MENCENYFDKLYSKIPQIVSKMYLNCEKTTRNSQNCQKKLKKF